MPPGIPKVSQNGPKMEPKLTQDGAKMEPKWFQDGAKIVPEGSKAQDTSRDRKSDPKSTIIPPNWSKYKQKSKKTNKNNDK